MVSTMADAEEGAQVPPPLFLDQTEAWRSQKIFFGRPSPTPLFQCLDDHPPPYLVWIRHCSMPTAVFWKTNKTQQC